jgi:hypothetical protein
VEANQYVSFKGGSRAKGKGETLSPSLPINWKTIEGLKLELESENRIWHNKIRVGRVLIFL